MALACQRDSYLRELSTTVKSCTKHEKEDAWDCILADTVLFPEGGGQPCDHGHFKLGDCADEEEEDQAAARSIPVTSVTRRGTDAVHRVATELPPGSRVHVSVDWRRRHDHMQQHSGQHLITAVATRLFGWDTLSWALGADISNLELGVKEAMPAQVAELEGAVNEAIRAQHSVRVHFLDRTQLDVDPSVRSRGLPDDVTGTVRIVEIATLDKNLCCGTHVSNLADVQAVKLLHAETVRGGASTRLYFVAGQRVLDLAGRMYAREKALAKALKCGGDDLPVAAERVVKGQKEEASARKRVMKELAAFEGERLAAEARASGAQCVAFHRDDADADFLGGVWRRLEPVGDVVAVLSCGSKKGDGNVLVAGRDARTVERVGHAVAAAVEGKGGGKGGKYQIKATAMSGLKKLDLHRLLIEAVAAVRAAES